MRSRATKRHEASFDWRGGGSQPPAHGTTFLVRATTKRCVGAGAARMCGGILSVILGDVMARQRRAQMDGRNPPKRLMDKLEAIRHLLHASIRMFFWEEDPFALHVVIYSCDHLIADYVKKKNIFVTFDWRDRIREEYQQAFYELRVETYDFLRHADRRPDQKLGVRDIAQTNELDLLMNVHRYKEISQVETEHSLQFMKFIFMHRPELYKSSVPDETVEYVRRELKKFDRLTKFAAYRQLLAANETFQRERSHDLCDLGPVQRLNA